MILWVRRMRCVCIFVRRFALSSLIFVDERTAHDTDEVCVSECQTNTNGTKSHFTLRGSTFSKNLVQSWIERGVVNWARPKGEGWGREATFQLILVHSVALFCMSSHGFGCDARQRALLGKKMSGGLDERHRINDPTLHRRWQLTESGEMM